MFNYSFSNYIRSSHDTFDVLQWIVGVMAVYFSNVIKNKNDSYNSEKNSGKNSDALKG